MHLSAEECLLPATTLLSASLSAVHCMPRLEGGGWRLREELRRDLRQEASQVIPSHSAPSCILFHRYPEHTNELRHRQQLQYAPLVQYE